MVAEHLREQANVMIGELESDRLVVSLAPSLVPEIAAQGGKIRVVDSRNPQWYQDFCQDWPARRAKPRHRQHFDTAIKRLDTLRGLEEIAAGLCQSEYAQRLLPVVESEYLECSRRYGI